MEREQEPVQKVKSVFIGDVRRKSYEIDNGYDYQYGGDGTRVYFYREPKINEGTAYVEDRKFFECDFEVPRLAEGEKLYINELDLTVKITGRTRSTNGETVYHTNHVVEVVDNEESKEELKRVQTKYLENMKRFNAESDQRAQEKLQDLIKKHNQDMKNNTWFAKLFGKGSIKL